MKPALQYHARIQDNLVSCMGSGLWIVRHDGRRSWIMKGDVTWEEFPEHALLPAPSLVLEPDAVRALASAMVDEGHLPRTFFQNDAENRAIKEHLADMKSMNQRLIGIVEQKL